MEDLAALLAAAKMHFPDLQGVTSGAIASDYQRLRVEAVSNSGHTQSEHSASPYSSFTSSHVKHCFISCTCCPYGRT